MMKATAVSIRPFIGAKDYQLSRSFYKDIGFEEVVLSSSMCLFKMHTIAFYLQDAYVQDWIDNTMIFVEVDDVDLKWQELVALDLTNRYKTVKLAPIRTEDWGRECFLHDPSGVLWHFGQFQ